MGLTVNIKKSFHNFKVDLNFNCNQRITVLFGPSGSGKSVTLQMIAGLITPDAGLISMEETEFFNIEQRVNLAPQQRQVGLIFQDQSLFPHMSVRQNIMFGARGATGEEAKVRCHSLLSEFDLLKLKEHYPHELSGGQKQRVAIAMNMMRTPKLLLMDEPFSALDSGLREKMGDWLIKLKGRSTFPIILVTHDLEEAKRLGDEIIYYEAGQVVTSIINS